MITQATFKIKPTGTQRFSFASQAKRHRKLYLIAIICTHMSSQSSNDLETYYTYKSYKGTISMELENFNEQ